LKRLATLPEELRRQLYSAIAKLDRKRTLVLIVKIKTIDTHLAAVLEDFVRNLAFEPLRDLIEKSAQPGQEDSGD
jgi:hypothetical protein